MGFSCSNPTYTFTLDEDGRRYLTLFATLFENKSNTSNLLRRTSAIVSRGAMQIPSKNKTAKAPAKGYLVIASAASAPVVVGNRIPTAPRSLSQGMDSFRSSTLGHVTGDRGHAEAGGSSNYTHGETCHKLKQMMM